MFYALFIYLCTKSVYASFLIFFPPSVYYKLIDFTGIFFFAYEHNMLYNIHINIMYNSVHAFNVYICPI